MTVTQVTRGGAGCGLYNPHTFDGAVVVSGFRTSTDTTAVAPAVAAAALAPARAAYAAGWGELVGGQWVAAVGGAAVPAVFSGKAAN